MPENKERYKKLLQVVWSLSNLFAENKVPYLYYRIAENIFCEAFDAKNLSRTDCTADASLDTVWYGLKTFICKTWKSREKIAEFNKERHLYIEKESEPKELVKVVSELRNKRIGSTMSVHGLDKMKYHCVARNEGKFVVHEEDMDFIDINKIKKVKANKTTIYFEDGKHEYSFNLSKSTLFKKFYINSIYEFDVKVFEEPLKLLEELFNNNEGLFVDTKDMYDEIVYLPLYSDKWGIHVQEKSWLNQWNASWRERNSDEAYIPIPKWIHDKFPWFFPNRNTPFKLVLPNGIQLDAKICQDNNKALMSKPNKLLWKWLLRDVLKKNHWNLVIYKDLEEIGIDSVEVGKKQSKYYINFKKLGTYGKFKEENT